MAHEIDFLGGLPMFWAKVNQARSFSAERGITMLVYYTAGGDWLYGFPDDAASGRQSFNNNIHRARLGLVMPVAIISKGVLMAWRHKHPATQGAE